jgi:hypothetical protein
VWRKVLEHPTGKFILICKESQVLLLLLGYLFQPIITDFELEALQKRRN